MNTLRKMEGTPSHIEYLRKEEGDERRDRRRCVKFRKEGTYCSVYCEKCHGSAHCPYYNEVKSHSKQFRSTKMQTSSSKNQQDLPFMSKVHHKKLGDGIVAGKEKGKVIIVFATKTKRYDATDCLLNGIIRRA